MVKDNLNMTMKFEINFSFLPESVVTLSANTLRPLIVHYYSE